MHDMENEVRVLLQERSGDIGLDPRIPTRVVRRSRLRRAATAGAAGLAAAALALVVVVGLRALSVSDGNAPAVESPSPTVVAEGWRGIWEYTTREAAEAAQAQVDEGHMPWQTDAEAFLEAYATRSDGLDWDEAFFDETLDISEPDRSGPLTIHLGDCPEVMDRACPHEADVTIERLLRRDRTGIWFVTALRKVANPIQAEVPSTFVGFADDAVVVASTETGEVLSTIAGPQVVGSRVLGADFFTMTLALAPDRTAVYFSALEPGGAGRRLMVAPLDGGHPEDLGPGTEPAPSPDGRRLAYVACTPDGCGGALVIRDLGTGAETRVPMGSSDMLLTPAGWLPDGRLAVNLYPGTSSASIRLIDPDRPPASLLAAPEVEPLRADVSWWGVGYHAPTGGLLVAEACCETRAVRGQIVSVDADSGRVLGTIARGGWWVVEPDASGRHLLLVDDQGRVYVSRDGDEPQLVAEGFSDVAW